MERLPTESASQRRPELLMRLLAETMIANVQETAALNRAAARALISQARLTWPIRFSQVEEDWSASQRGLDLSAQAADRMLGLARLHIAHSAQSVMNVTEALFAELSHLHALQVDSLRSTFDAVLQAQQAYLEATARAQRQIVALSGGTTAVPGATAASPSVADPGATDGTLR